MIVHTTDTWRDLRPPSNDERRAEWAAKYYRAGLHRRPELAKTQNSSYLVDKREQDHEKR